MAIVVNKPQLSFSSINLRTLKEYFDIELLTTTSPFNEWFGFNYTLSKSEQEFLQELIEKNRFRLRRYSEQSLIVKFIGQILNEVDFATQKYSDWYHEYFKAEFDHLILSGYPDYMVAKGVQIPELPFFFLQEFKPTKPDKDPEDQLLAEMIAAIELNESKILRGGYITGQIWNFVIVEKIAKHQYKYAVSDGLDALGIKDLTAIYTYLQALKSQISSIA